MRDQAVFLYCCLVVQSVLFNGSGNLGNLGGNKEIKLRYFLPCIFGHHKRLNIFFVTDSGVGCYTSPADSEAISRLHELVDSLQQARQHLTQMWHARKLKLEQCFQLRLFEQDAEKVNFKNSIQAVFLYWMVKLPKLPCRWNGIQIGDVGWWGLRQL